MSIPYGAHIEGRGGGMTKYKKSPLSFRKSRRGQEKSTHEVILLILSIGKKTK
jgi:hypothetical protein